MTGARRSIVNLEQPRELKGADYESWLGRLCQSSMETSWEGSRNLVALVSRVYVFLGRKDQEEEEEHGQVELGQENGKHLLCGDQHGGLENVGTLKGLMVGQRASMLEVFPFVFFYKVRARSRELACGVSPLIWDVLGNAWIVGKMPHGLSDGERSL